MLRAGTQPAIGKPEPQSSPPCPQQSALKKHCGGLPVGGRRVVYSVCATACLPITGDIVVEEVGGHDAGLHDEYQHDPAP